MQFGMLLSGEDFFDVVVIFNLPLKQIYIICTCI